ncbi:LysR family transcriptional regulator [Amycolatopsis sp. NBC_01480]|uniref:LysR family transcriptional regulator n=1 Tax=Amycolatopsis sp. NBC_01480 TaxID=2903562 RepID=UPI002E2DF40D|nr:LysR family transcriptional regulator [Amycolatopsis sp. NBC_01480]
MSGDELRDHLEQMDALAASYKHVYERNRDGTLEDGVATMEKLVPSDTARVWRSYNVPGQAQEVTRPVHEEGLRPLHQVYTDIHHEDVTFQPFPGGFVFQCIYSFTAPDGTEVRFPAALVWYINSDGKVVHINEHFESYNADKWFPPVRSMGTEARYHSHDLTALLRPGRNRSPRCAAPRFSSSDGRLRGRHRDRTECLCAAALRDRAGDSQITMGLAPAWPSPKTTLGWGMRIGTRRVSADDLLILLEVARSGRLTRAAEVLGFSHTTVARRIESLERALGGKVLIRTTTGWDLTPLGQQALRTAERVDQAMHELDAGDGDAQLDDVVRLSTPDAFSVLVAAPAAARLNSRHPRLRIEIVSATRPAAAHRSGLDIEVVIGEPRVLRADAVKLASYTLGLFGSHEYLAAHGAPGSVPELTAHGLVYFIPSMLQIDDLDVGRRIVPEMRDAVTSTNVFAHVAATRAGAGLGLLPTFLAERHDDLVRVLPAEVTATVDYWLVTRTEALRRPAVAATVAQLKDAAAARFPGTAAH